MKRRITCMGSDSMMFRSVPAGSARFASGWSLSETIREAVLVPAWVEPPTLACSSWA